MKAVVKYNYLEVEQMNRFDYFKNIQKVSVQHPENKRLNGYFCKWGEYTFWIDKNRFSDLFVIGDED